ncbi:MAG: redox-regulated ATPase YchF [Bacteroidales bacterium]|nr:redox-regulated ATPase YchF [Bacteroidales bacterium]
MSLRCAITGIANVGKTTIFNCMSRIKAETSGYAFTSSKSNIGVIHVPDQRLYELEKLQPAEKVVPATVEILDIPGLTKGASHGEGVGNKFLADIRNADALIHVLRCFDDDSLPHVEGSVDPLRDIETLDLELQVRDLESVEKKLERMEKLVRSGDKDARQGVQVLLKVRNHLESFGNVRDLSFDAAAHQYVDDLFLLTAKPVMFVCNVDDASAIQGNGHTESVMRRLKERDAEVLIIAARLEAEIADFDNEDDRLEFLNDAGLAEPGVNRMIRSAYSLLSLMSFFTVGPKEIRAWSIRKGMTAQQAAGAIHSDLERGFIRAEVIKYEDFIGLGSEHACREKGKLYVEGKNYVVQDGDILHIRFNV